MEVLHWIMKANHLRHFWHQYFLQVCFCEELANTADVCTTWGRNQGRHCQPRLHRFHWLSVTCMVHLITVAHLYNTNVYLYTPLHTTCIENHDVFPRVFITILSSNLKSKRGRGYTSHTPEQQTNRGTAATAADLRNSTPHDQNQVNGPLTPG